MQIFSIYFAPFEQGHFLCIFQVDFVSNHRTFQFSLFFTSILLNCSFFSLFSSWTLISECCFVDLSTPTRIIMLSTTFKSIQMVHIKCQSSENTSWRFCNIPSLNNDPSIAHAFSFFFYYPQVWGFLKWLNGQKNERACAHVNTNNLDKRIGRQDKTRHTMGHFFSHFFYFYFYFLSAVLFESIRSCRNRRQQTNDEEEEEKEKRNECLLENSIYLWQNDNHKWHIYFGFGNYHIYTLDEKFTQPLSS